MIDIKETRMPRGFAALALMAFLTLGLAACDEGPAEEAASEAGEAVDDAVESVGEAAEDAGDAVEDAAN